MNVLERVIDFYGCVPDKLPTVAPTAIVGLALSSNHAGECSKLVREVVTSCVDAYFRWKSPIIFSNKFTVREKIVAYEERKLAVSFGVPRGCIILPEPERNHLITNTRDEIVFAFEKVLLLPGENKLLHIVDESLHMRRTLLTIRREQLREKRYRKIKVSWESVRAYHCYGTDTVQRRFLHPVLFIQYEWLALAYSKKVGWI